MFLSKFCRYGEVMEDKCVRCVKRMPVLIFFGKGGLAAFQLFVGLATRSKGLVADGIHSISDVVAALMMIIGLKISNREEDEAHPWGRGKVEFVFSLLVYTILIALAIFVFIDALETMVQGNRPAPHMLAFLGGVLAVVANFIFSYYGLCAGRKANSSFMIAYAKENRWDIVSGVVVTAGVLGANMGYVFLDSVAALIVAVIIFRSWAMLWLQAFRNLLDESLPHKKIKLIKEVVLSFREVQGISFMKTRLVGQSIWIDIEILVSSKLSVQRGYAVAREIRLALIRRFRHVKDVTVTYTCQETPLSPVIKVERHASRHLMPAGSRV